MAAVTSTPSVQEANLWRKLKSKDVVKLVGIGATDLNTFASITSSMYIVCEFMEGGTLREAVERQMLSAKKQVYRYGDVFRCLPARLNHDRLMTGCHPHPRCWPTRRARWHCMH